jgi:hypothetical protein
MSKTIVFKPKIEAKLKKLRIKQKFVKNWKANKWLPESLVNEYRKKDKFYEEDNNWKMFIHYAFEWARTEEGREYWSEISKL